MTIAVSFVTVADSISKLSISGVNVKDLNEIPTDASKVLPVLYPIPNGFVTDVKATRVTMGGGGTAKIDFEYTLNYRYLHSIAGADLGLFSTYTGLMTKLELICEKILASDNLTGAIDVTLQNISNVGPLTDPAGKTTYHGVDIALRVLEFAQ